MISPHNVATNNQTFNDDFTVDHYRELIKLALHGYKVANYDAIPWSNRFVLWRHDLDYSLNRGLALARIEREEGLKATYFINSHSEFYNIAEIKQHQIIQDILSLGHDLGLHFDAAFYGVMTEQDLDNRIAQESAYMHGLFGIKPVAFSFHNPVAAHLTYEAEDYGGLVNCYSSRFKTEVGYCSDSNGYWRFRRLHDVLLEAKDDRLQVLTHPGWWQDKPMPPRQRVFRSIYGRARAILRFYDQSLEDYGRVNMAGEAQALRFLERIDPDLFVLCDYLWNTEQFPTLFLELWRIHENQIVRMCRAALQRQWLVSPQEVGALFDSNKLPLEGWKIFKIVFGNAWITANFSETQQYYQWVEVKNLLLLGREIFSEEHLEAGCIYLCNLILSLVEWGQNDVIAYDGFSPLESSELSAHKIDDKKSVEMSEGENDNNLNSSRQKWEDLKARLQEESVRVGNDMHSRGVDEN